MRQIVTGSIATDHLMVFPGRFTEQLIEGQLHKVSLSFLVDELKIRRGGIAANVAFGMAQLGLRPVLVGSVGADFAEYRQWLEAHRVETRHVRVSENLHTARFLCTTDADNNQIARMPGADLRRLADGARYLFTNEYERELLIRKTGWPAGQVLRRVGTWVTTTGSRGVVIEHSGGPAVLVGAAAVRRNADPTGVGDGFRAGFLAGISRGLGDERSAQVGCVMASLVLETTGTQEYEVEPAGFLGRVADSYGAAAAAEIAAHMSHTPPIPAPAGHAG
jgi:adenosine kinase